MRYEMKQPTPGKRIFLPAAVRYAIISSWGLAVAAVSSYILFKLGY